MSRNLTVPQLGLDGGLLRVGTWLVEPGDSVFTGERVVELGHPGVVFVVSSTETGTLLKIVAPTGSEVREGDLLGTIVAEPDTGTE